MIGSSNRILMGACNLLENGNMPDWNGVIITPSSVSEYEAAVESSSHGTLIIIDGEIYGSFPTVSNYNKTLYIRGINNGTLYNTSQYDVLNLNSNSYTIVENVTIKVTYSWRVCLRLYNNAEGIMNKCSFVAQASDVYPISGNSPTNTGEIIFSNCLISRGYSHFQGLHLAPLHLQKVQLNNAYYAYGCDGTLAESDYVTSAITGYGPNYGDFLIPDSFLVTHGIL